MIRSYVYRLFTNANQERELARTLETHRRIYNAALDGRQLCWEAAGVDWSFCEQSKWFTKQRTINPHWAQVNSSSARRTLQRLENAYRAFFARCESGGKPGHPRFKTQDRFNSFSFRLSKRADGCSIVNGKLRIQHIGTIRVRWHRALPHGQIKEFWIFRNSGKWFVSFVIETTNAPMALRTKSVGIDVGLKSFVTTSDGDSIGDSRTLERALPELRRRQRALSRCKSGSNRRQDVKYRVTSLHAKVRNVRKDMHHKVAKSLVDRYGVIAAESLNIERMRKNRRLARRIADAGWYSFVQILIGKAESAGCKVVLVDPRNTSQECSACGEIVRKSLVVRVHRCECGCVLDRDVNAAKNVLARAAPGDAKAHSAALSRKSHTAK